MRAMVLPRPGLPLEPRDAPLPDPGPGEIRLRVAACGVCRTDLHVVDGELPDLGRPVIPGHEIVGRVEALGAGVDRFRPGDRVGVPWLGWTCGACRFCTSGRENLCVRARFTGYHRDGGYAEAVVADARYAFALPDAYADDAAAPLLCAGLIGYRAWAPVRAAGRLGLYGFGAAAHLVAQLARAAGQRVFAFTRAGAEVLAPGGAEAAGAAGPAEPGDAHAVPLPEARHPGAERVDPADDLVPEDERELRVGQLAVGDVEVGAAHAAGGHAEAELAGARLGQRHVRGLERRPGRAQQQGAHGSTRARPVRGVKRAARGPQPGAVSGSRRGGA